MKLVELLSFAPKTFQGIPNLAVYARISRVTCDLNMSAGWYPTNPMSLKTQVLLGETAELFVNLRAFQWKFHRSRLQESSSHSQTSTHHPERWYSTVQWYPVQLRCPCLLKLGPDLCQALLVGLVVQQSSANSSP